MDDKKVEQLPTIHMLEFNGWKALDRASFRLGGQRLGRVEFRCERIAFDGSNLWLFSLKSGRISIFVFRHFTFKSIGNR
jgi:hypothetical protein